ncbi:hypothetical protein ACNPQM_23015 [Streptomyces sp. NPDC056231]|uniref:hypothetical protein n=1 Tax=Streptomyces sp. NPDC056231 TaxID=3345755 RepID=UPI003AAAB6E5
MIRNRTGRNTPSRAAPSGEPDQRPARPRRPGRRVPRRRLDTGDPDAAIRAYAPWGVDWVTEVVLSYNADVDNAVAANQAVIAACRLRRRCVPTWPRQAGRHAAESRQMVVAQ